MPSQVVTDKYHELRRAQPPGYNEAFNRCLQHLLNDPRLDFASPGESPQRLILSSIDHFLHDGHEDRDQEYGKLIRALAEYFQAPTHP
jgi:hypothetical protein